MASTVIIHLIALSDDWNHFLSAGGEKLSFRTLGEAILSGDSVLIPTAGWLVRLAAYFGVAESATLSLAWWSLLGAAVLLVAGLFCRSTAVAVWLLYLATSKSADLFSYGLDSLTTSGLFYLMLSPLPDRWAADDWIRRKKNRHEGVRFMRRVLQLHLCVIYFFSGLVKCLGTGWWTGANVWRALTHPPFNILDPRFLTEWRYLFPLLGALVCLMETSYPLLIWPTRTRAVWLGLIISMHIVIALLMGMYLFALVMIVLNIAAFGTGEWLTVEREHRGAPGVD